MKKQLDLLELKIQENWDRQNLEGIILYNEDLLSTKKLSYKNQKLYLLHNACRDVYDQSLKSIDLKDGRKKTFQEDSNPEIARSKDGYFKVLGNRFACMQYQCILVPYKEQDELSASFLNAAMNIAKDSPQLTLMYNSLNAGKTVPNQYLLLSFHQYEPLKQITAINKIANLEGIELFTVTSPVYMICFNFSKQQNVASKLLLSLSSYMEHKNFNIFLYAKHAFFIPRENLENPVGFENHRFGGLEMIGYFIMKSKEALDEAEAEKLVQGIRQISFSRINQRLIENAITSNSFLRTVL